MKNKKESDLDKVSTKLNLIASLLIDLNENSGHKMSVKDKVNYLLQRGVSEDDDISKILNITKGHSSKEKALLRSKLKNG